MYQPKSFVPEQRNNKSTGFALRSFQPEKRSWGGLASNVVSSGVQLGKDIINPILHPIEAAKGAATLTVGAVEKFRPGITPQEKTLDAAGQFYKDRYGGVENIKTTAYTDPLGFMADASMVIGGAGAALKGAGTAGKVSALTKAGKGLTTASKFVDPIQLAGKVAGVATRPVSRVAKSSRIPKSSDIITRGLGNPAKQRKMITPMEELIPKHKLYARTPEVAQEALDVLKTQRTKAVGESGAFGNLQDLIKPLDNEIQSIKSNPNLFRGDLPLSPEAGKRLSQLTENRNNIVKRFAVESTTQKSPLIGRPPKGYLKTTSSTDINPKVSVSDIDAFRKESIDPNIPEGSFAKQMSARPARDKAFQQTRKALKGAVDEKAGTKQIGSEMQSLIEAKDVFEGHQARVKNRQTFNFTKLGGAGVGGLVAGIPGAVGAFAAEQFVNSPKGLEIMYKTLKKVEDAPFGKTTTKTSLISRLTKELNKIGVKDPSKAAREVYNYARTMRLIP